jgi:hypothetical protein
MRTIYTFIFMGMLSLAPCKAVVYPNVPAVENPMVTGPELTETRVRTILTGARPQLEQQLNRMMTQDYLYQRYLDGQLKITYLGFDGIQHEYQVDFDGGVGISGLDNF